MRNACLYSVAVLLAAYGLLQLQACQGEQTIRTAQYAVNGQKLYAVQCRNCHGAKGEGLGKLYPPLTDSASLNGNRSQLACIIRHGRNAEVAMPPNPQLTPVEIAYLLTYIGNAFGNQLGIFTQEEVERSLAACGP